MLNCENCTTSTDVLAHINRYGQTIKVCMDCVEILHQGLTSQITKLEMAGA